MKEFQYRLILIIAGFALGMPGIYAHESDLQPTDSIAGDVIVADSIAGEVIVADTFEAIGDTITIAETEVVTDSLLTKMTAPKPTSALCGAERFKWTKLIAPVALIGVGFAGVYISDLRKVDDKVKDGMAKLRGDRYLHFDDYIQYVPAVAYLTLGFIPGMKHKHSFRERLLAGVTAHALMGVVTLGIKYTVREMRPDTSSRNSFPSGHTATVFTGAELVRLEYGPWVGLGAYAVATTVAFMRLYNERHWLNDVIAGAGIGILSANAGYWLLPWERKLFKLKGKEDVSVVPYYSPIGGHSAGLCLNVIY